MRIVKIVTLFSIFFIIVGFSAYLTLTLIIKGENTVVVPDLIEKDVVYALELLTDLGLNTKVEGSEYNAEVPKNNVIFQDPDPGSEIKKGRDVRIILSKGPKSILMPKLEGLPVQQAQIILEENSLCKGEITHTYSYTVKKDAIIAQTPSPGTLITRGNECVNLLVSMGFRPRTYKMPDLTGLPLERAIPLIEDRNLVLGAIKSLFYKGKALNTVISQEPLSGYLVTEKTSVNLVINRKSDGKTQRYLKSSGGTKLFRYRLKDGILKRHIRVVLNGYGVSNDIFDGFMKPGKEIQLIIPGNINATVFLYEDGELIRTQVYEAW